MKHTILLAATAIVLLSGLGSAAARADAASPFKIDVEPISPPGPKDYQNVVISPDRRHIALVAPVGSRYGVYVDGKPGPKFDEICRWSGTKDSDKCLLFSSTGGHCAYIGRHGDQYEVVQDDQTTPIDNPNSVTETCFSNDGSQFAFALNPTGKSGTLVLNGKAGQVQMGAVKLGFTDDGAHFSYVMNDVNFRTSSDDKGYGKDRPPAKFVHDGTAGPGFDEIPDVYRSSNADHYAYVGLAYSRDTTQYLIKTAHFIIDGKEVPNIDGVSKCWYSPDGNHVLAAIGRYIAGQPQKLGDGSPNFKYAMLYDGQEWPYHRNSASVYVTPVISPDGKKVAFAEGVKDNFYDTHLLICVNGQEGDEYEKIDQLQVSADSQHVAYRAEQGGRDFVVFDGKESAPIHAHDHFQVIPTFSPDGKHIAFEANDDTHTFIMEDGAPGMTIRGLASSLVFSPAGDHLIYLAGLAEGYRPKPDVVLDNQVQPGSKTNFGVTNPVFSPDGHNYGFVGARGVMVNGHDVPDVYADKIAKKIDVDRNVAFTSDNAHVFYREYLFGLDASGRDYLMIDGIPLDDYERIAAPIALPDGRIEYIARKEGIYNRLTVTPGAARNFGIGSTPMSAVTTSASKPATVVSPTAPAVSSAPDAAAHADSGAAPSSAASAPSSASSTASAATSRPESETPGLPNTELYRETGKSTGSVTLDERIERDLHAPNEGLVSLIGASSAKESMHAILDSSGPLTQAKILRLRKLCSTIEGDRQTDRQINTPTISIPNIHF